MSRPTGAVLSDRSIRDAVATRLLVVEPFTLAYVQPSSLDLTLGGTEPLVLERGVFTLAATAERLCLPPCIQGQVHGRSSIGRLGVLVHFTAGLIDPGFDGVITLEMMALDREQTFEPGDRIAQISFHWLDRPAEQPYSGRYQRQRGPLASLFLHAREEEIIDASR
jgi:dCTP deaminase